MPSYSQLLRTLQDPAVRDLAWVIGSPGLVDATHPPYAKHVMDDAWCAEQINNSAVWFAALDKNPGELHQFIAARPTRRLGHYFETLIVFWLNHQPDTEVIAANLQVRNGNRTVGEYDLLIRTAHQVNHWEVAVKFYLSTQTPPAQHTFLGPGGQDRLDLKLARIFQHQLRLSETPSGIAALPDGVTLNKTQTFIKGYLFYPANYSANYPANSGAPANRPTEFSGVSALHLSGWWSRQGETPLPQHAIHNGWIILPRLRWLSPARLAADADIKTHSEMCQTLAEHFKISDEALLLVELQRDQENIWHEVTRGFVVHEGWPEPNLISIPDFINCTEEVRIANS